MDANTSATAGYLREKAYLAVVMSYDEETGLALMTQRNKMVKGESIELLTPGKVGQPLTVCELYDADHNEIEDTRHPYMTFYMKMPFAVKPGDIIRAS
jgi:putative protease